MNQQIIATPEYEGPVRSETRNGMRVDWDVPLPMDDGLIRRADVYRPIAEGRYPVIMGYGRYAKLLHFEDGYVIAWRKMVDEFPEALTISLDDEDRAAIAALPKDQRFVRPPFAPEWNAVV
jgi:hypothetical protein